MADADGPTASPGKPPVVVDLAWEGALRFRGATGPVTVTVDSDGKAGPSPVQALALALAGCMSVDVVHILQKGRQPLAGLRAHLVAERAPEDPHRLVRVDLRFTVAGDVPAEKVERAIALSQEKYCSVWHSLRQDIAFTTSFETGSARP
jgi:putative redox protein